MQPMPAERTATVILPTTQSFGAMRLGLQMLRMRITRTHIINLCIPAAPVVRPTDVILARLQTIHNLWMSMRVTSI